MHRAHFSSKMATFVFFRFVFVVLAFLTFRISSTQVPDWNARLSSRSGWFCATDAECNYLGTCDSESNKCKCSPGFSGSHCHRLDLLPTEETWGFNDPERHSWGGNVIKANGKYHLFASYMTNKCDISQYGTNSAVLRATSTSPEGPYVYQETILSPFHHGATILQHPVSGSYYLWTDGIDIPSKYVHNCKSKTQTGMPQRTQVDASQKSGLYKYGESPHDFITVSTTTNLEFGNWTQRKFLQTNIQATIACNRTNLSPLFLEDGSLMLAIRTTYCSPAGRPACDYKQQTCQHIFLARAASPESPVSEDISQWRQVKQLEASEDPFLWVDRYGRYHMLVHSKRACGLEGSDCCGLLASSDDGEEWTSANRAAYHGYITFRTTGKMLKAALLQRPKILFADDGYTPLFFICGYRKTPLAHVRTLMIPFNVPQNAHLIRNNASVHWTFPDEEQEDEQQQQGETTEEDSILQTSNSNIGPDEDGDDGSLSGGGIAFLLILVVCITLIILTSCEKRHSDRGPYLALPQRPG